MKLAKITSILLYILLGVATILGVLFYTNSISEEPLIDTMYVYVVIAAIFAIGFPVYQLFTNPKGAINTLIGLGVLGVIVLIAYSMASDQVLNLVGYNGPDNVPSTLKTVGTGLITTYILFFLSLLAIAVTEIYNAFK